MSKRSLVTHPQQWLLSPGLHEAPVLDLMCSHFVLTLAARQGAKFNVRRDLNGLLALSGRHLVWPPSALERLREFLARRCVGNEFWRDHESLSDADFMARHGEWRGPWRAVVRHDLHAFAQVRRHQDGQDRGGRRLARRQSDEPLPVLPILGQRR